MVGQRFVLLGESQELRLRIFDCGCCGEPEETLRFVMVALDLRCDRALLDGLGSRTRDV